jgi:hypothetical protein
MNVDDVARVSRLFGLSVNERSVEDDLRRRSGNAFEAAFRLLELAAAGKLTASSHPADTDAVDLAYRAILQRRPESLDMLSLHADGQSLFAVVEALFTSEEWKLRLPALMAGAFPEAPRLWYPHIPKTAGTSFVSAALADRRLGYALLNDLPSAQDLQSVGTLVRAPSGAGIIITGHVPLNQFWHMIGPFDDIITFVRDPIERALSMFQFARDVTDGDPDVHAAAPDIFTRDGFVYDSFEDSYSNGFLAPNDQCRMLGVESTCQSVIEREQLGPLTILLSSNVDAAIRACFPASPPQRLNVSRNSREKLNLSASMIDRIRADNAEDEALYRTVSSRGAPALPSFNTQRVLSLHRRPRSANSRSMFRRWIGYGSSQIDR